MTPERLDEILTVHWPRVLRRTMTDGSDEWAKGFVKSVARHGKRCGWRPSEKQAWLMERMVSELGTVPASEVAVIEG